jgi:endonuclease/exonuclease/phosphatase family metal-dependent hydrolase
MILITWNVQWCRGADGRVDPARILRVCRDMADFDVLCCQEVARDFPALAGSGGADLFAQLAGGLRGYTAIEGIAIDAAGEDGERAQFGVLILTRRPVLQVFRHLLPWPADLAVPSMQRVALEAVIDGKRGPLRVTTTHLEYYSAVQRSAQVERLRDLQAEAAGHAADSTRDDKVGGPFAAYGRPACSVLCGDLNFPPDDAMHARLQAPIAKGVPAYRDAWRLRHPKRPHVPTIGLYDKEQWPGEPYCSDFIFVTEDLADRVADIVVNVDTNASDHQPILLKLAE